MIRFVNDFHSWLLHWWKSLANRLTCDPKVVIHGNSCISLFLMVAVFTWFISMQIICRKWWTPTFPEAVKQHKLHLKTKIFRYRFVVFCYGLSRVIVPMRYHFTGTVQPCNRPIFRWSDLENMLISCDFSQSFWYSIRRRQWRLIRKPLLRKGCFIGEMYIYRNQLVLILGESAKVILKTLYHAIG